MKNLKLSVKISMTIIAGVIIGLLVLFFVVNSRTTASMTDTTQKRMMEAVDARAQVVNDYVDEVDTFLTGVAENDAIMEYMADTSDRAKFAKALAAVDRYYADFENMEGLFVCDYSSEQLLHSNHEAIGEMGQTDPDKLKSLQESVDSMWSSGQGYLRGMMPSQATGTIVIVYYVPIFDFDGNGTGYVGCGINASGMIESLSELEFHGWSSAYLDILSTDGTYVWAPDETLIGTVAEDSNVLSIVENVAADTSGEPVSSTMEYNSSQAGGKVITCYESMPEYGLIMCVSDLKSEIFASTNSLSRLVMIICIIEAIASAILCVAIVSISTKGLSVVGGIVERIAQSMDMTGAKELRVYTDRADEVGIVAKATVALTDAVTSAVMALQEHGKNLYQAAENLADMSGQTLNSVNQVEAAVRDIAEGATSQADETENASGAVVEIGNQIEDAATATASIMATSENMQKASAEVTDVIEKLVAIGEQTSRAIDEIYDQTNTTNESAMKIKSATEIITSIAEETNLLSLNASIEAARAGEQGKGFAVVASQIQKLAEQSSSSAQQIDTVIAALIADSQQSVDTMEEVKKVMAEQSELVKDTGEIFSDVRDGIEAALDGLDEISRRTRDIDGARQSVVDVVGNLSAIAEENAASTEETSASVTIVNDLMTDISETANNVSSIAEDMDRELSVFKVSEDQAAAVRAEAEAETEAEAEA